MKNRKTLAASPEQLLRSRLQRAEEVAQQARDQLAYVSKLVELHVAAMHDIAERMRTEGPPVEVGFYEHLVLVAPSHAAWIDEREVWTGELARKERLVLIAREEVRAMERQATFHGRQA